MNTRFLIALPFAALAACSDSTAPGASGFLGGTGGTHEIGVVMDDGGKTLTLFQLGSPTTQKKIELGASSEVTPVGFSMRGTHALVPLGNAASLALIDLETQSISRFYTFTSGNATGSAFADDTTIIATNPSLGIVGRVTTGQTAAAITQTANAAPQPTAVAIAGTRALVTSANLDENFAPIGNGVVTVFDTKTLQKLGEVSTGGTNSSDAALGPDGKLYVLNTGDYVSDGSLTIIDPATITAVTTVAGMGVGPGAISIDKNGLAYISGFFFGTLVWNTNTRAFVRGPDNPVCAKTLSNVCRGAFAATTSSDGTLYQLYFGSAKDHLPAYAFVYSQSTFALKDSISVGTGPSAIAIKTF